MALNPHGLQGAAELHGEHRAFGGPTYGFLFREADLVTVRGDGSETLGQIVVHRQVHPGIPFVGPDDDLARFF